LVVNRIDANQFEEEEEKSGLANELDKVKGEDPATPGCQREDRVRRYVSYFKSWVHAPLTRARKP